MPAWIARRWSYMGGVLTRGAECGTAPSTDRDQPRAPAGTCPGLPPCALVETDGRIARRSLERVQLARRDPRRHRRRGRLRAVLGRWLRCLPPHPRRAGSASRRPPGLSRPFNQSYAGRRPGEPWAAPWCDPGARSGGRSDAGDVEALVSPGAPRRPLRGSQCARIGRAASPEAPCGRHALIERVVAAVPAAIAPAQIRAPWRSLGPIGVCNRPGYQRPRAGERDGDRQCGQPRGAIERHGITPELLFTQHDDGFFHGSQSCPKRDRRSSARGGLSRPVPRRKLAARRSQRRSLMSMSVGVLDHYNVSTRNLGDTVRFYEDVLGLTNGPRPPFDFPGAWLCSDGRPVLPLNDISPTDQPQRPDSGVIDHVAFGSRGFEAMKRHLGQKGVSFRVNVVPNSSRRQIFVTDPNNVLIELNFDVANEPAAA